MSYEEAVRYLLSLGRELASPQQARAAKFDLVNVTILCTELGEPQRKFASVHVAGTNGKGSTAAMIESILRTAGLRTGLYTSPHLERINERIRVNGEEISDGDFAAALTRLHRLIEELLAAGKLAAHPTFFECMTALAFDYFASAGVQYAVCEVGMGGRLDSTNILVPRVSVITQIDFDHESYLGHSIEEIAGEKAGIIKAGVPVVSAAGNAAARKVIRARAAEQRAPLLEIEEVFRVENLTAPRGNYSFTAVTQDSSARLSLSLPVPGKFQVRNALAAVAVAQSLAERGAPIGPQNIAEGIARTQWPGRLERISHNPDVYLDGMHNPGAAREIAAFWDEHLNGRRVFLIFAAMRDKAVDEVAGLLFPRAATVILTTPAQPRAISGSALAAMAGHYARQVRVITPPDQAFEAALQMAAPEDVIFVAGSLFLVGALRRYARTRVSRIDAVGNYTTS